MKIYRTNPSDYKYVGLKYESLFDVVCWDAHELHGSNNLDICVGKFRGLW